MLRPIGIAPAQHVEQPKKQHEGHGENRYRHKQISKTCHRDSMKGFGRPRPEPGETRASFTLILVSAQQPLEIIELLLRTGGISQLAAQFLQDALGPLGR